MRESRGLLIKALRDKGKVKENIIKVDTFLNHCVDIQLVKRIGQDIARYYTGTSIDKIITVEASGIIPAMAAAMYIGCDMVYAKKKIPLTMEKHYSAKSYSFTKQEETTLHVSQEVLHKGDRLLFVDDFYAGGNTLKAIESIAEQAGAEIVGRAVIIDKAGREDVFSILTLAEIKNVFAAEEIEDDDVCLYCGFGCGSNHGDVPYCWLRGKD
jgi:xanthine phosphoribosyltransferase